MSKLTDPDEIHAYANFVHSPAEAYRVSVELAKVLYGSRGVSSGSKNLDEVCFPTIPSWVRVWLGAQGQGKTTVLRIIANLEADKLLELEAQDKIPKGKFYVAHMSWETAVDAQEPYYHSNRKYTMEDFWKGKVDPALVIQGGLERSKKPIYWLGESMDRTTPDSRAMTVDLCIAGMRALWREDGKVPSCIVMDYVQEVEVAGNPNRPRTERVIEAMRQIIHLGTEVGCAIELGAQARRVSLQNNPPLPNADDVEWAHYVIQKATNVNGIWRPWTTHAGDKNARQYGIECNSEFFDLTPELVLVRPLKHRPGRLGYTVPMQVYPDLLKIIDFKSVGDVSSWFDPKGRTTPYKPY